MRNLPVPSYVLGSCIFDVKDAGKQVLRVNRLLIQTHLMLTIRRLTLRVWDYTILTSVAFIHSEDSQA